MDKEPIDTVDLLFQEVKFS